eukprot:jgi/Chrzof1/12709/Cz07g04240.t1
MLRQHSRSTNLLVQPTSRGPARGTAGWAFALDIFLTRDTLNLHPSALDPTSSHGEGLRFLRVLGGSDEHRLASNLVQNMPKSGQVVVKVAGAFAVHNAVSIVTLGRQIMKQQQQQDLVMLPIWEHKHGGVVRPAVRLLVLRCTDAVPLQVLTTQPHSHP